MTSSKLKSLVFFPFILLTGCATIVNGTNEPVSISSNPAKAEIYIDGKYVGRSPSVVNLTRKDKHFVRIELEGYQPYETIIENHLSRWALGNIVFGGFIGIAVDAISGGLYTLTPEQIQAEMQKTTTTAMQKADGVCIAVVTNVDPSWKKIDHMTRS